jgi:hypothetical protein
LASSLFRAAMTGAMAAVSKARDRGLLPWNWNAALRLAA